MSSIHLKSIMHENKKKNIADIRNEKNKQNIPEITD
jgi:hypothetical protein